MKSVISLSFNNFLSAIAFLFLITAITGKTVGSQEEQTTFSTPASDSLMRIVQAAGKDLNQSPAEITPSMSTTEMRSGNEMSLGISPGKNSISKPNYVTLVNANAVGQHGPVTYVVNGKTFSSLHQSSNNTGNVVQHCSTNTVSGIQEGSHSMGYQYTQPSSHTSCPPDASMQAVNAEFSSQSSLPPKASGGSKLSNGKSNPFNTSHLFTPGILFIYSVLKCCVG